MSEAPRQDCPSPTHSEFVLDPSTLQAVDSAQELVHSNSLSLSQGGSHNSSGLFWNYSGSGMFAGSMLPSHPDGIAAPILANMDQSGFWSSGPSSAAHKHQRRHSPRFVTSPVHQISRSTSQRLSSMVDPQIEDGSRNSNTSASNSFLPNSTSNTMYPRAVPCVSASSTTVSSNQSYTPVNIIPCLPPPQPANYMLISPQAPPTIYVAYHSPLPMVSPVDSVVPIPAMGALTTTSIGSENVTLSYDGNKTLSAQNRASSAKGLTPPLFLSSPATATPESGGSLVVDTDGSNQNMPQHPGMLGPRHLMKTPPEDQMIDSSSLVVGSERRTPQSSHGQLPGLVSSIGWPHAQPVTASGWFTSALQTNVKSPSDVEAIDRAHLFSSDSSDDGTEAFESGHRPMGYQPPAARRRSTCSSLREIPHASLKK